jgi:hypothetical protein
MKKQIFMLAFGGIGLFMLSSCGGNDVKADAKKLADIQCRAQQMQSKAGAGDMASLQEATKLAKESMDLLAEMQKKYTSASDKQELQAAMLDAMKDCK